MTQILVYDRSNTEATVQGSPGQSVMEVVRASGLDLDPFALCGGACSCATCHVYVEDAFLDRLDPMSPDEDELLESSGHRRKTSRLSCQIACDERVAGMQVTVAPAD